MNIFPRDCVKCTGVRGKGLSHEHMYASSTYVWSPVSNGCVKRTCLEGKDLPHARTHASATHDLVLPFFLSRFSPLPPSTPLCYHFFQVCTCFYLPGMGKMEKRIIKLERDIDQLKKAYDRYFSGVERLAPEKMAASVAREIRSITKTVINNTALRFRAQQAISRYQTYLVFWQKNLRDFEEGRTPRRRLAEKPDAANSGSEAVLEMSGSELGNSEMDEFFSNLSREYQRAGIGKVPEKARIRQALEEQTKSLREKFACDKVVFKIVNEDGKIRIKASPSNRGKK